jgi:hypothetical protein
MAVLVMRMFMRVLMMVMIMMLGIIMMSGIGVVKFGIVRLRGL